jgi:oxygen-independent coproporphyrinogen-3 oxidase
VNGELIEKSKEILKFYSIKELEKAGIKKRRNAFEESHTIITYPPRQVCEEIKPEEIFARNKRTKRDVALYVHIPFCTGKCLYCHYVSLANQPLSATKHYLNAIKRELDLLLKFQELRDIKITSIMVGGGTPTYLSCEHLKNLMDFLNEKLNIERNAEITFESSPETLIKKDGDKKLKILLKEGANRLSIGIQSLDDEVLKTAGRRYNAKEAIMAFELARKSGFTNINVDLMIGLADQTLQTWNETLNKVEKLMPESINLYHCRLKHFVPFFRLLQKQPERFPSEETQILMDIMLREKLSKLGYKTNPALWFSKKSEYVYQHQKQKWQHKAELLGLGVSAYSFMNNTQYYNYKNLKKYLEVLDNNKFPIWKGLKLNPKEQIARKIIFGLKMAEGIDKSEYYNLFKNQFDKFKKLGLLEINDRIKFTQKGLIFVDEVCKEFYSEKVKKQYSNNFSY